MEQHQLVTDLVANFDSVEALDKWASGAGLKDDNIVLQRKIQLLEERLEVS